MSVRVAIIHPSFGPEGRWIDDFVESSAGYRFEKYGLATDEHSWHSRGARTTLAEWSRHFRQAHMAVTSGCEIVVASFPPLILAACIWKALLFRSTRVIGWSFNFGGASRSRAAQIVGRLFRTASLLVTHSRAELATYARIFALPATKLRFVPLQCGTIHPAAAKSAPDRPYLIAMGSAGRDYATLFAAVRDSDFPVLVIAKEDAVAGLDVPANVEIRSGLTLEDCWALAAEARAMALPVAQTETASGQVTFLAAMALRVPLVATQCPGTEDYLTDGSDSILIAPQDAEGLRAALERVMSDDALRERLADAAYRKWQDAYSDEAAARNLISALDAVAKDIKPASRMPETSNT